jgi:hypothetical protein
VIIDTHGHMIPPDLLATIRKEGLRPALRIVEAPAGLSLAFGSGKPGRPIMTGLNDLTGRLAWMDVKPTPSSSIRACFDLSSR